MSIITWGSVAWWPESQSGEQTVCCQLQALFSRPWGTLRAAGARRCGAAAVGLRPTPRAGGWEPSQHPAGEPRSPRAWPRSSPPALPSGAAGTTLSDGSSDNGSGRGPCDAPAALLSASHMPTDAILIAARRSRNCHRFILQGDLLNTAAPLRVS